MEHSMPTVRFGAILAVALAICAGGILIVPLPTEAHGATVKIVEDGSNTSGRYWDGSNKHTAPFYTDVTVHSNGTVTFWGTTVCAGTIVYSDHAFTNEYYNFQRIPIDRNNAAYNNDGNGASLQHSNSPAYCTAPSAAQFRGTPVHVTDVRSIKSVFSPGFLVLMKSAQGYVFDLGTKFTFDVKNKQTSAVTASGYSIPLGNIFLSGQLKSGQLISVNGGKLITNDGATLVGNDGSSLIGDDGSSLRLKSGALITNDGGTFSAVLNSLLLKSPLITNDGGTFGLTFNNLISDNGLGLVGTSGGTLITDNGGGLIAKNGAPLITDNGGGIFNISTRSYASLPTTLVKQCSDNRISVAYGLSGLGAPYALTASDSGRAGKCNPSLYLGGNYIVAGDGTGTSTVQALVPIIKASTSCYPANPWIGEALWQAGIQRQAFANSCSPATYVVNGQGPSSYGDLLARVKAHALGSQGGAPGGSVDQYGCTSPNYGVALFPGNIFEAQSTPNLDKSKAVSFRCSNQVPAGYTRPYPVPAYLLLSVAPPTTGLLLRSAVTTGVRMPSCATNDPAVALFDPKYPTYLWFVSSNPTLDLSKATSIVCYSRAPRGRYKGSSVPADIARSH
jgi:hypothetical protein